MEKLVALSAPTVMIVAAVIANVDAIAVGVDSEGNFIGEEIFVALVAQQVLLVKAMRANIGAVMNHSHLAFIEVLFAMLAKAVVFVQAMFTDVNAFAMTVNDFPRAKILALLAEFGFVVAVVAEQFGRKFASTGNAKPIGADLEDLEIVGMVLADRNLGVEVGVNPITISAEAVTASDTNVVFVAAVFFGFPEIGDAFKFGKFALNKVAIKL